MQSRSRRAVVECVFEEGAHAIFSHAQEPSFVSPIRLRLLDVSRASFDAIRARAIEVMTDHRDVTLEDPHAQRELEQSYGSPEPA